MPSRRSYLATLGTVVAGCTAGPDSPSTGEPAATPAASPSPTPRWTRTPSDTARPRPADHPALSWAVRLPEPTTHRPAVDLERNRVYVAAGHTRIGTPTGDRRETASGLVVGLRASDGEEAWRAETDAPAVERPVVHDGRVHAVTGHSTGFGGIGQRVTAYARDGTRRWATGPRDRWLTIVAAHGGSLFVGTGDDALGATGEAVFAVASDGDVRWEREAGDAGAATVSDARLLYSAGGLALVAYDVADGTVGWEVPGEPQGNPVTGPAAFEGRCFTQSPTEADHGYPLVAHSTTDGRELWRYSTAPGSGENFVPTGVANVPESIDGANYDHPLVGTEYGGTVFALQDDGSERWTFAADAETRRGPVVGDAIYVGDAGGTVYALEPYDGSERWRASLPRFAGVRPLSDGVLAFSYGEGRQVLASLRGDGSERWRYTTSRNLTTPVVAGDRTYAGAHDGTVLAFAA